MLEIAVVGTGYVGLVTGTCFAETGNNVVCVDINQEKVDMMRRGIVPIYEPGLEVMFERNVEEERLTFTTSLEEGIQDAQIIFLALPTPSDEDGSADLSSVLQVAEELGPLLHQYTVIVDKSTVPVGTADKVYNTLKKNATVDFDVVSNPEFLREGVAVEDFMKPERVIIGADSDRAREVMDQLYKPFVRQGNPILNMDVRSAELTKYASNAFLATKISFMNEVANLCEKVGADVDKVRLGMGTDSRIGKRFLFPGVGFGGSCFPKDVKAIIKTASESDYNFRILNSVMEVNEEQKTILFPKIKDYYNGNIKGKTAALWGLAFKPNTDDIREAPALYMIDKLLEEGVRIQAYDPEAMKNVQQQIGDVISYMHDPYEALEGADFLVIMTEWSVFRNPDYKEIRKDLRDKVIFDGRNLFEPKDIEKEGFDYISIGRENV